MSHVQAGREPARPGPGPPAHLQLLGAVAEGVLPAPGLLQHLRAFLLLHLLLVLQVCYLLILVFHLPVDEGRKIKLFIYMHRKECLFNDLHH